MPARASGLRWTMLLAAALVCGCASRRVPSTEPHMAAMQVVVPKAGRLWSVFGDPRSHGPHKGIDIEADQGVRVWAAASGVVVGRGRHETAGRWVEIEHSDGTVTRYLHLARIKVRDDEEVRGGRTVARLGRSGNARQVGPHLHFEVVVNGVAVDPLPFLEAQSTIKRRKR